LNKYGLFFSFLLLSGCLSPEAKEISSPPLTVELTGTNKTGNHIDTAAFQDSVILNVISKPSIGKATISPVRDSWPSRIVIRLHLRGLESFSVNNGKITITTSLLSHPPYNLIGETRMAGQKRSVSIQNNSPYWMPVSVISKDKTRATIPLEDGYIEVLLPEIITRNQPELLSIQWIDFLR